MAFTLAIGPSTGFSLGGFHWRKAPFFFKPGPSCLDLALYPRSACSLRAKKNHRVTGRQGLLHTQGKRKGTAHSDNWLRATCATPRRACAGNWHSSWAAVPR
eukprot:gene22447-biopygen5749